MIAKNHLTIVLTLCIGIAGSFAVGAEEEPAPATSLRIAFIGDSITGPKPGQAYQHQYLKFADLVGLMVEAHSGQAVTVLNHGLAGDRSYKDSKKGCPGAHDRVVKQVIPAKPDIAVVLIGGYDAGDATEHSTVAIRGLLRALQDEKIKTLTLTYHQARSSEKGYKGFTAIIRNNELIATIATELKLPLLAMEPPMAAAEKELGREFLVAKHDGVHLKPAGEMVYARAIFKRLRGLGWLKPAP